MRAASSPAAGPARHWRRGSGQETTRTGRYRRAPCRSAYPDAKSPRKWQPNAALAHSTHMLPTWRRPARSAHAGRGWQPPRPAPLRRHVPGATTRQRCERPRHEQTAVAQPTAATVPTAPRRAPSRYQLSGGCAREAHTRAPCPTVRRWTLTLRCLLPGLDAGSPRPQRAASRKKSPPASTPRGRVRRAMLGPRSAARHLKCRIRFALGFSRPGRGHDRRRRPSRSPCGGHPEHMRAVVGRWQPTQPDQYLPSPGSYPKVNARPYRSFPRCYLP